MKRFLLLFIVIIMITAMIPAYAFRDVSKGSKGDAVIKIQKRLNELGYSVGTVDGDYGAKTEAAVRTFQSDKKLKANGIVNEETYYELFPSEKPTNTPAPEPTPTPKPLNDNYIIDDFIFLGMGYPYFNNVMEENKYVAKQLDKESYRVVFSKLNGEYGTIKDGYCSFYDNYMIYGNECDAHFYFSLQRIGFPLYSAVFVIYCNSFKSLSTIKDQIRNHYGNILSETNEYTATQIDLLDNTYFSKPHMNASTRFRIPLDDNTRLNILVRLYYSDDIDGTTLTKIQKSGKVFIEYRLADNDEINNDDATKLKSIFYDRCAQAYNELLYNTANPDSVSVKQVWYKYIDDEAKSFWFYITEMNRFGGYEFQWVAVDKVDISDIDWYVQRMGDSLSKSSLSKYSQLSRADIEKIVEMSKK